MTERTPDERIMYRNEDEPEVEGHKFRHGPEDVPAESERRPRLNEDDEGPEVEGHRYY
jgi:hypothetical protein